MVVYESTGLPGGSAVKKPPAMQKTWVQSLGQEDSLEEEINVVQVCAYNFVRTQEKTKKSSLTVRKISGRLVT